MKKFFEEPEVIIEVFVTEDVLRDSMIEDGIDTPFYDEGFYD